MAHSRMGAGVGNRVVDVEFSTVRKAKAPLWSGPTCSVDSDWLFCVGWGVVGTQTLVQLWDPLLGSCRRRRGSGVVSVCGIQHH